MTRKPERPGKYHWRFDHVVSIEEAAETPEAFPVARWASAHRDDPDYVPRLAAFSTPPPNDPDGKYARRRERGREWEISWNDFFAWLDQLGLEMVADRSGVFHVRTQRTGESNAQRIVRSRWDRAAI